MTIRLTSMVTARNTLADLNRAGNQLDKARQQASSGKVLTRPSDDPYAAARSLKLREGLAATQQQSANANDAVGWQDVTEQAYDQISQAVLQVRDLVVQGGSDSAAASDRKAIATQVRQVIDAVKDYGNVQYAGRYVFAGTKTTTQPFPPGEPDTYQGDTGAIAREIGPGVAVQVNTPGSDVLGSGSAGDLLGVLRGIVSHLESDDGEALRDTDLAALDGRIDALNGTRAVNAGRSVRVEAALSRLDQVAETTTKQLSDVEDADYAKTMIDYSTQYTAYQAALKAGANIMQTSLMDFLR